MADHGDHDHDEGFESEYATERETAPQGPFTARDVGVGLLVAVIGIVVVFGIPILALGL